MGALDGTRRLAKAVREAADSFRALAAAQVGVRGANAAAGAATLDEVLDEGFRRKALPKTTEHLRQLAKKTR